MLMKLKNNMKKLLYCVLFLFTVLISELIAKENFFEKGKKLYESKKYDDSKFFFQRNIVFNPKDSRSYLYLAKIFKIEENQKEEEKNINTTLLLEPKNEEAMFMLIDIELERSNFSKVKQLKNDFKTICSSLCDKLSSINERLNNIEAKDES